MPSDLEAIQGLWRVVSYISQGSPVISGTTHYQFEGNRVKEFTPSLVDGGSWATFELDSDARPKRITKTYQWPGKDGEQVTRTHREAYELSGDTLRICWPRVWGTYPDVISDKEHGVVTLVRDYGPPPNTKRSAVKKPIEDPVLGRVTWDDNFDLWEAQIELKPGLIATVSLEPGERPDQEIIEAGREAARWLRKHEPAARRYAADQMLDNHNDNRNDGDPISARTF